MKFKNKQTLYLVMRHDFTGQDVAIAVCSNPERADELHGMYEQQLYDVGVSPDEAYFYITGVVYYD